MDICFWHCDLLQALSTLPSLIQCISGTHLWYNQQPFSINTQLNSKWELKKKKKSLFLINEECHTTNTFPFFCKMILKKRLIIFKRWGTAHPCYFPSGYTHEYTNFCFKTNRVLNYYELLLIFKKKSIAGPYIFQLRHSIKPPYV